MHASRAILCVSSRLRPWALLMRSMIEASVGLVSFAGYALIPGLGMSGCPVRCAAPSNAPPAPGPAAARPADLVQRQFAPSAPNRLWVADLTYVSTWSGFAYVAFFMDAYARRILGSLWPPRWRPRWCSTPSNRPSGHDSVKVSST